MSDLKLTLDLSGLDRLRSETPARIGLFLDGEAETMVNGIKQSIQDTSPGRTYGNHTASLPGDAPNIDEGRLWNSYTWEPDGNYTRYIGTDVEYAVWLEFGTEDEDGKPRMLPRPHVGPEVERERGRIAGNAKRFRIVK